MSRKWAMPSSETFSIPPIGDFVRKYLHGVSVDPFARDCELATYTNDLNPNTKAKSHLDAIVFLNQLADAGLIADVVLFDPPYSPRQITECYSAAGLNAGMIDTQSAVLYMNCRNAIRRLCKQGSVVLSFGWNSCDMGSEWDMEEILLVAHGGAHNDTICTASRMVVEQGKINFGDLT